MKVKGGNFAEKESDSESEEEWEKCFMAGTTTVDALTSINFDNDWIIDFGYGHHLTSDDSKFSSFRDYNGNDAIITANNSVHPVEKEGIVTIKGDEDDPITLDSVFQVPGMKKNLSSVALRYFQAYYQRRWMREIMSCYVKFLRNISSLKADIIHTSKRVKDLFVLSSTI